jgi:hypothetical protein
VATVVSDQPERRHFNPKEVITMEYEKPEVTSLTSACLVVQNHVKFPNVLYDAMDRPTIGAYEADE